MDTYTAAELADLCATTPARVEMWARAKVLRPVDPEATPHLYDRAEVRPCRAAVALAPLGVPHPQLLDVADLVRGLEPGLVGEVVVHPDGLVRIGGPRDGACWVLPLAVVDGVPVPAALAG